MKQSIPTFLIIRIYLSLSNKDRIQIAKNLNIFNDYWKLDSEDLLIKKIWKNIVIKNLVEEFCDELRNIKMLF